MLVQLAPPQWVTKPDRNSSRVDPAMSWAWAQDSAGRPSGGSGGRVATLTIGTDDRIGVIRLMVASENSGQPPGFEML
jgi:hypothetical protein